MKTSPAQTYRKAQRETITAESFRNKLKLKSLESKKTFQKKYPEAQKFLNEKGIELGKIRQHSAKIIGAGALTGTLLLTPPTGAGQLPQPDQIIKSVTSSVEEKGFDLPQKHLVETMSAILPENLRSLNRSEEKNLEKLFLDVTGIPARATLEGEHLNTTYGLIGAEQHLKRYPGDIVDYHGPFFKEGIAPGLGAWGHFAKSKAQLTPELIETEKWYAVVQTLYLHDWNTRQPHLRNWYKYRKVMLVNTTNGNAVVAAIADAGPAAWTGKVFGGSPEVMEYLGGPRYKKGPVVLFFVDDPENKVPLGPVEYNKLDLPAGSLIQV
ncbi:hypothetical protein ISR94_03335 [Candidatus Microgenomates bacterium]|nr:hypothetical protein [Candidatus Microgenomates bacterium]